MALKGGKNADRTDNGLVDRQALRYILKEKREKVLASESVRMRCKETVLLLSLNFQISGLQN